MPAESVGMMKVLGGVKLSVPMVELLIHAVDGMRTLCQAVGVGRKEGGVASENLTPLTLEVGGAYSGWACVEMLLNYLPLFKNLFAITVASFKKVQSHVSKKFFCIYGEAHVMVTIQGSCGIQVFGAL